MFTLFPRGLLWLPQGNSQGAKSDELHQMWLRRPQEGANDYSHYYFFWRYFKKCLKKKANSIAGKRLKQTRHVQQIPKSGGGVRKTLTSRNSSTQNLHIALSPEVLLVSAGRCGVTRPVLKTSALWRFSQPSSLWVFFALVSKNTVKWVNCCCRLCDYSQVFKCPEENTTTHFTVREH